jgi:hypothetical protein
LLQSLSLCCTFFALIFILASLSLHCILTANSEEPKV